MANDDVITVNNDNQIEVDYSDKGDKTKRIKVE